MQEVCGLQSGRTDFGKRSRGCPGTKAHGCWCACGSCGCSRRTRIKMITSRTSWVSPSAGPVARAIPVDHERVKPTRLSRTFSW